MKRLRPAHSWCVAFVVLWAAVSCRPPASDRWQELYELRRELQNQEAHLIFPIEFIDFDRAVEGLQRQWIDSADLHPAKHLVRILNVPALQSPIELQILAATRFFRETRKVREKLESERLETIAFVHRQLAEMGLSLRHAELRPLVEDVEEALAHTHSFLIPGSYAEDLDRLKRLAEGYKQLRSRWIRYHGGVITAEEFQTAQQRFHEQTDSLRPEGYYIVIDTALNRLYLKKGDRVILDAPCSTGSRRTLVSPAREWTFETPRGEFTIRRIIADPSWRRPDWAFLEEGQPIPRDERKRWVQGALGAYALGLGGSYFIHGTEYTRLLGQNVTHGCIRLGAEDLAQVAALVSVGAKVYIF